VDLYFLLHLRTQDQLLSAVVRLPRSGLGSDGPLFHFLTHSLSLNLILILSVLSFPISIT